MGRRRWAAATAIALVVLCACASTQPIAHVQPAPPKAPHAHTPARAGSLRVPILMYHHVGAAPGKWRALFVSLPQFARQMAAIARSGAATLTIQEVYAAVTRGRSYPNGAVALTFDDGTADQFAFVFPILRQYELRATFYVAPGLFGKPGYLSWAQARTMARSGLVSFEAHTLTHADLTRIPSADARMQLREGKRLLETRLGVHVRHVAYPYGHVDDGVLALVRDAGFLTAVTTRYQWDHQANDALTWGRLEMHETNEPENLAALARSSGTFVPAP
jgi:peptidoglycan/xylan/chitin deacetylase (PgdA/CDA1 family)